MKTAKDILDDAAELIEQWGWLQGAYERPDLGYCAIGAVRAAAQYYNVAYANEGLPYIKTAYKALIDIVGGSIEVWNDTDGRTAHEVVVTLRKAAENA